MQGQCMDIDLDIVLDIVQDIVLDIDIDQGKEEEEEDFAMHCKQFDRWREQAR